MRCDCGAAGSEESEDREFVTRASLSSGCDLLHLRATHRLAVPHGQIARLFDILLGQRLVSREVYISAFPARNANLYASLLLYSRYCKHIRHTQRLMCDNERNLSPAEG